MSRFTDRELTVQENIWLQQCRHYGDYEALILLMESRLIEPESIDLRSLPVSDLQPLVEECKAGIETGDQITQCLLSVANTKPKEKEGAYGTARK
jgi:hypothetical protein